MNGLSYAPAAKPGDDLLFHCLSNSTIGAVRFHGRVRDGIGWVTDAMATKLWGRRIREPIHKIEPPEICTRRSGRLDCFSAGWSSPPPVREGEAVNKALPDGLAAFRHW